MKKMIEHQIDYFKKAEAGIPIRELYRKYGMDNSTFYKWCVNTVIWKPQISNA